MAKRSATARGGSRWIIVATWLAPVAVAAVLVALLVIPLLHQQRLRRLSDEAMSLAAPSRDLVDTIGVTAVRQSIAARGALTFPEQREGYERSYEAATNAQEEAFHQLLRLSRRLDEDAYTSVQQLLDGISAWHVRQRAYFRGELPAAEYRAAIREQDALFQRVLDEWWDLSQTLQELSEQRRARSEGLVQRQLLATTTLALVALATLLIVLWLARRGRLLERAVLDRKIAERASQARAEVLAQVSHDLRSPLSAITLSCDAVRKGPAAEDGTVRRSVERIDAAARRMSRLVGDLLDHARLSAGHGLGMRPTDLDVEPVLRRVRDEASPDRPERVALEVDPDARRVFADADRLEQVLLNLLGNALKFSPPGRRVRALVRPAGDDAVFTIVDEGPGISEEERAHLFEAFWQSKEARRPGYGLGLSIARAIVESHGGHIWVDSTEGDGSAFSFTLPRA